MEWNESIKKKLDSWEYSSMGCSAVILENGQGLYLFVTLFASQVHQQLESAREISTEAGARRVRSSGTCWHLILRQPKR